MKKRILSLLGIIALFLGVILVSCGNDDDNKNTTGVHKIVIEQRNIDVMQTAVDYVNEINDNRSASAVIVNPANYNDILI